MYPNISNISNIGVQTSRFAPCNTRLKSICYILTCYNKKKEHNGMLLNLISNYISVLFQESILNLFQCFVFLDNANSYCMRSCMNCCNNTDFYISVTVEFDTKSGFNFILECYAFYGIIAISD